MPELAEPLEGDYFREPDEVERKQIAYYMDEAIKAKLIKFDGLEPIEFAHQKSYRKIVSALLGGIINGAPVTPEMLRRQFDAEFRIMKWDMDKIQKFIEVLRLPLSALPDKSGKVFHLVTMERG